MAYNKFYGKLFLILILLSVTGAISLWSFTHDGLIISRYILLLLWIILIISFFRYIYKTTSVIKDFIITIKDHELIYAPDSKNIFGEEFKELLNFLNQKIKTIRIEKEEQYHLFKNAVDQAGSGVIVYDETGTVEIINPSALHLFSQTTLKNIHTLAKFNPEFPKRLLTSKEKSFIIPVQINHELYKIAIHQNNFILRGKMLKVVSLQNISNELDKEELKSWKKLMHVITHEIMNSVTPMKTLAYSLQEIYSQGAQARKIQELDQTMIDDTFMGLKALNNRVQGLMGFVESYRKLYKIPEPIFRNFHLSEILDEIKQLFKSALAEKNIQLTLQGGPGIKLFADKLLLTQVFINILNNATDALSSTSNPEILIHSVQHNNQTIISIRDNGKGISSDSIKDIFVPFYTTKNGGTGIGLYYSRMIIHMHKGQIKVSSQPGKGSTFSIHL
ncbi:MAG: HAMP domain-containing sensor histidine kinase [Bacteroidales bacterium]|jgi:signal transduction histidine kinase|nr:HAMP domain-containing sensor histidine kinase [Bacteroidales bacterium]